MKARRQKFPDTMRIRHIKGAEEIVSAHPLVVREPEKFSGIWAEAVFGNSNPVYLEIGSGMGAFLREFAGREENIDFVGLEINTTVLLKALARYERELGQIPPSANLRFIRSDARFLADYFGSGELQRIYLNFSDPWPKDKNRNKRLTAPAFLSMYRKILKTGGELCLKTDNEGLFDYSLPEIRKAGFSIVSESRDLHRDRALSEENILTEYERKFISRGAPIYMLRARKDAIDIKAPVG